MKIIIVESRDKGTFQFSGYYYSDLLNLINKIGKHYIANSYHDWEKGNVIIFNYPENPFKESEIEKINELVKNGKLIIFTGYYGNEDNVCDVINDVTKEYGIKLLESCIEDKENCIEFKGNKNEKMVYTSKVYHFNEGVKKVLLGYCAPVEIKSSAKPLVESEKGEIMAGCYKDSSGGGIIAIGTCTFWDNFSIDEFDNKIFARNLLTNKF